MLGRRHTLSGTVVGADISAPVIGQKIEISYQINGSANYIFRGLITSVNGRLNGLQPEYQISAEDFSVVTSWRIISFAAFNKTAKEIITEYIKPILLEEGFAWDDANIEVGATFKKAVFNLKTVEDILNSITDASQGYSWSVEYPAGAAAPMLVFKARQQSEAQLIDEAFPAKVQRKRDEKNYRNVQILVGSVSQTATQDETLTADENIYVTRFPVALQPDIYVDGVLQTSVGVLGLDNDAMWLWSYQSKEITYNGDDSSPASIRVVYVGLFTIITKAQNGAQIAQKSAIWGSGKRENITKNENVDDTDVAAQEAQTLLNGYGQDNDTITLTTEMWQANPSVYIDGDTLYVSANTGYIDGRFLLLNGDRAQFGNSILEISADNAIRNEITLGGLYRIRRGYLNIDGDYICSQMTVSPAGPDNLKINATLSNGKTATWIDYFRKLSAPAKNVTIAENEVAQVEHDVTESTDFDGVLGIVVNSRLYPAATLYPSASLYPGVPASEVYVYD